MPIILTSLFFSCNGNGRNNVVYLSTKDKKQIVTIISDYSNRTRVIIDGRWDAIPEQNYIKVSIAEVPALGDEMGICWGKNDYVWEIAMQGVTVIESKLDQSKFKFKIEFDEDEYGVPNVKRFVEDSCYHYGFDRNKITPIENGFVTPPPGNVPK